MTNFNYDAIVIGSGHAGCEASLALARLNKKTLMVTLNLDSIAFCACNPSIGGTAKGQLVGEIDALGGEMAVNADKALLQLRILNGGKGPAVQSLRAQVDKNKYHEEMKKTVENQENLDILQAEVTDILVEDGKVIGIKTCFDEVFYARAVVVTTGVYLNAKIFMGDYVKYTGPNGFEAANKLTKRLENIGFKIIRLKTGTPARIDGATIDYSKFEIQEGDKLNRSFSYLTKHKAKNVLPCFLGYTTKQTKDVIEANLEKSPTFNGGIVGIGPRYCPSIESKIVRFADKERHQLFLEPETLNSKEVYVQGISTAMPVDIQRQIYSSISGLENAKIMRFAYSIEYDAIDATQLKVSLESKKVAGLFFAGQVNGTSGYEEAAAQGIIAGINASNYIENKPAFVLKRDEAYIGVLIDDLVTKNISEPYRMMTSRAEYRLVLRQDNCDIRLTQKGYDLGLVSKKRYSIFKKKLKSIENIRVQLDKYMSPDKANPLLERNNETPAKTGISLRDLLKRSNLDIYKVKDEFNLFEGVSNEVLDYINTETKYEGYIKREIETINRNREQENYILPTDLDYNSLNGLRLEARQKLSEIKPYTLGQASRIDGVSPADINVLIVYLKLKGKI